MFHKHETSFPNLNYSALGKPNHCESCALSAFTTHLELTTIMWLIDAEFLMVKEKPHAGMKDNALRVT